ncbi:tautomerase family protein [Hyphomicrobium facile]|uniref:Tautomerase n=1 Tax=Hyphomicrobium facile TaxID=51670 RepID=A0A1I7MX75_9HYPH|nr:4-oxalocrotonate tautomerase family protein [Hyphomicrobium facile]SFV26965.1 4-oxalocrotonate tautomerase [Hyphomicrobium facile]
MPIITVEIFPGRTNDQKRRIAKRLTDSMVEICGAKPQAVHVLFTEVDPTDWAVAGELCSDRASEPAKSG